MPRRKNGKRPRAEDANQDTSEPMAKRMDQLNLDASSVVEHDMQQETSLSTLQEQLTSQDDESSNHQAAEEWQLAGLDPQLALSLPAGAYEPEIPAADNPHYYQVNKVLFAANLERIKRQQQSSDIDL